MTELNKQNSLRKSIKKYFENEREFVSNDVFDFIYSTLIEYINCDDDKLAAVIEYFASKKDDLEFMNFRNPNNQFDISRKGYKFSVKGFKSKDNHPILYFYRDEDTKPIFKISEELIDGHIVFRIASSNDSEILANYKNKVVGKDSYFLHIWNVSSNKEDMLVTSMLSAKAGDKDSVEISPDDLCDEYRNFYSFISNTMNGDGQNALRRFNPIKADIMFSEFYQIFKEANMDPNGFTATDLVLLMNMVFSDELSNVSTYQNADMTIEEGDFSPVLDKISKTSTETSTTYQNSIFEFPSESGKPYKIRFNKLDKYLSVDVLDKKKNSVKANYMFSVTPEGFAVFRLLRDAAPNTPKLYTLNLAENKLKLMIYDDDLPKNNGHETVMTFCENGDISIQSNYARISKLVNKQEKYSDIEYIQNEK